MSPNEYIKSDWLKKIKQDFVNGVVPASCNSCKSREDQGLRSTRGTIWKFHNISEGAELDISKYSIEQETSPRRIEVRFSNLCNFKCRMCNEGSSSEIAKEQQSISIPIYLNGSTTDSSITKSADSDIEELKQICFDKNLYKVVFTGGEPLLIKEYYDFMDFLIDNKLNESIGIELFTNCSVYNPKFVERLLQFKRVDFIMSIDGVGKTAEYQRHGTNWDVVRENILKFNASPFDISFNTAISSYVLLDVSSLAKFLMELYANNNNINTRCYSVHKDQALHHRFMNLNLRKIAINEIDKAISILTPENFKIFVTELKTIKHNLENTDPTTPSKFTNFTRNLDLIRNESFEDTFKKPC